MSAWTHHDMPKRQMRNTRATTTTSKNQPAPAPVSVAPTEQPQPPVPFEPDPNLWVSKAEWDEFFAMFYEVINPFPQIKAKIVEGARQIEARKAARLNQPRTN